MKILYIAGLSFVALFIVLSILLLIFGAPDTKKDSFYDYDWSDKWTALDKKGRKNADCKPITIIHRKLGLVNPYIWIVPDSCEQGLPHTRAVNIVAIPKSYPKNRLENTLEHEKIHLYQRSMPDSWRKFYRVKWHYETFTKPPAMMWSNLIKMRRSNPDTADSPWVCWMNRYWPVPVYVSENDLSLSKAQIIWWDQRNNSTSNDAPYEWLTFFGESVHQLEHPHEISAEFLAGPLKRKPDSDDLEVELPDSASQALRLLNDAWRYDEMYPLI